MKAALKGQAAIGRRWVWEGADPWLAQPVSVNEWLRRLAPGAAAMLAIGTCATWGGVPAAAGNISGAMSLMDFLGPN